MKNLNFSLAHSPLKSIQLSKMYTGNLKAAAKDSSFDQYQFWSVRLAGGFGISIPIRTMGVGAQNHLGGEINFARKILQRTTSIIPDAKIDA